MDNNSQAGAIISSKYGSVKVDFKGSLIRLLSGLVHTYHMLENAIRKLRVGKKKKKNHINNKTNSIYQAQIPRKLAQLA